MDYSNQSCGDLGMLLMASINAMGHVLTYLGSLLDVLSS